VSERQFVSSTHSTITDRLGPESRCKCSMREERRHSRATSVHSFGGMSASHGEGKWAPKCFWRPPQLAAFSMQAVIMT